MDRRFVLVLLSVACLGVLAGGVFRQARASSPEGLLPNLVADPPDNASLTTSSIEGHTRLLLRFNGYIHNDGSGALDIRGSREAPEPKGVSGRQLDEDIALYKHREESLPQGLEEELATPAMTVSQRLYTTNEGDSEQSQTYLERPHLEEPSTAEVRYSSADGHHHWHLQHVARYSLWNASKSAEVAPSQKVGFCLDDSERVESYGPKKAVYANDVPPYEGFCRQYEPNATTLYEGISPGWRDVYNRELAFQWVDVSDVAPGEYWLREDIDPTGVIKQSGGGPKFEYSATPTVIPGFDAEAQTISIGEGQETAITLGARAYEDHETPLYTIVEGPQHGTLGPLEGNSLTYKPAAGYSGEDSFTFSAADPTSQFPERPAVATVSIAVGSHQPTISISGGQAAIPAATSLELSTSVSNDSSSVEWKASAGKLTPLGTESGRALFTAPSRPPVGGRVTITARLSDHRAADSRLVLAVTPVGQGEPEPVPEPPQAAATSAPSVTTGLAPVGLGGGEGRSSGSSGPGISVVAPGLSRPRAMLVGRMLVLTTVPSAAGRVRLTAHLGSHPLGACTTLSPAGRTFTCRIRLGRKVSLRAPISVHASLRIGHHEFEALLPAGRIPEMRMRPVGPLASAASGFWCSPSTLAGVLVEG